MVAGPKVGVLALQGAFAEHAAVLDALDAHPVEVRRPSDLAGVEGLILPGGESTTMSMLLASSGLHDAVAERLDSGLPVLGTCAGLILLATDVLDGRPDQRTFAVLDVTVCRNGYGRQKDSFETELEVSGIGPGGAAAMFPAVFIRAPRITRVGGEVDVLASVGPDPVLVRRGPILAAAFHPELSRDLRLHHLFLGSI